MNEAPAIMVLDRNARNLELVEDLLRRAGYRTAGVSDLEDAQRLIVEETGIAMALLDIGGFDSSVWQVCAALHDKGIPFLVVSPGRNEAAERQGYARGARGFLIKPLTVKQLLGLVRSLLGTSA